MKPLNLPLTITSIFVLAITIAIMIWQRGQTARALEEAVEGTVLAFDHVELLGEPTDPRARFEESEQFVTLAKRNPFIRELVVSKRLFNAPPGEDERPIVPFQLYAQDGPSWLDRLAGFEKKPLRSDNLTYGYLYFDLDRSTLLSANFAIVAASVALVATLVMLLGRVYFQETTLMRIGSELKQRQRELIRLERLALAGQLSANLLHDLKKPVLNVRHSMEDLREALGDFGGSSAPIAEVEEQIDLYFQMLDDNQIERFVRSDRLGEEYVDLNDVIDRSIRLVHYERGGITVKQRFEDDLPPVLAQPYRMVQVFSNLILNAYQAMGERGSLTITTARAKGGIEARVTDNGPGIEAEDVESIFEPFFSTKTDAEGSGLGLAISRLIIELLDGRISVESPPGGPTTFIVWLPPESEGRSEADDRG